MASKGISNPDPGSELHSPALHADALPLRDRARSRGETRFMFGG
jgi:hypothetical protein